MKIPTIFKWTSPLPFKRSLGGIFHLYSNFDRTFCKQAVETLIFLTQYHSKYNNVTYFKCRLFAFGDKFCYAISHTLALLAFFVKAHSKSIIIMMSCLGVKERHALKSIKHHWITDVGNVKKRRP